MTGGGLAGIGRSGQSDACNEGGGKVARGCGEFVDGLAAAREKARLLKKVGGRITADGQFRKDGEAGALFGGATGNRNDFFKIAGEIPDRGVDLGQCDLHSSSLMQQAPGIGIRCWSSGSTALRADSGSAS